MFASKKDFAVLARQVSLSSREHAATSTEDSGSLLLDIYQIRLWKLLNKPDKIDIDAMAETFQV